jgi:protein-L-isoaspartate(D-aspartate) O-methyltransferase
MKKNLVIILALVIFIAAGILVGVLTAKKSQPQAAATPSPGTPETTSGDPYLETRLEMVRETIEKRGVQNTDVILAMRTVSRERFVQPGDERWAYNDQPLPIGYGQTISQPFVVALMTEKLELKPGEKILEIGTGSGYQAAVLAQMGFLEVYSIEIIPQLAESAARRLKELGYNRVTVSQGDGYFGWQEHAPYDAILVTAAPDHLPQPLVNQITEKGRIVIPIGPAGGFQTLWKFVREKGAGGGYELKAYNLGDVRFVPLTGGR